MCEFFITVSVIAKDKLEAMALVKNKLQCANGSEIIGISTDNPYDIIDKYESNRTENQ